MFKGICYENVTACSPQVKDLRRKERTRRFGRLQAHGDSHALFSTYSFFYRTQKSAYKTNSIVLTRKSFGQEIEKSWKTQNENA